MLTAVAYPSHLKTGNPMSHPHYRSQSVPAIDIEESFKRSLRKRVEYKLTHRFYEAQEKRDNALSAAQDDDERARANRNFEEMMNHLKVVAEEEYQSQLRREIANRSGVERREEPESVEQQQQRILDSIQRGGDDHITYPMRVPSAQGVREHGVRRPSFTTAPHPEIWRPPTANPEPSGIARTFAHAHAHAHAHPAVRPPTAPPQMRRGSTSGGHSGQGISTASEQARAAGGRYTPNPVQQSDWSRGGRARAPSDALGRQSPATATTTRPGGISSSAQQRWEPRVASRPIATRATPHDNVTFPTSGSPSRQYGMSSSPSEARQGIAIPRSRFANEDTGRSASYGSSSLRNDSSARWGSFRRDIVRESPESDEIDEDVEDDIDDQSNGDFAHSLELGQSPEDRRRAEEKDRLLAVRLQREEMRAAEEERKRRKDSEDSQGHSHRRTVDRERHSMDAGRNGFSSPASWTSNHRASPGPAGSSGKDERRKALLEQEMFPGAGSSRARQQENAVAGPSGSKSSRSTSKTDSEAMDRKISSMRTKAEECLEEMIVEMTDLRNKQLEDAGDDDNARAQVMMAYTTSMESVYGILEDFNARLQGELREKRQEIAIAMSRVQQNGAGIRIQ